MDENQSKNEGKKSSSKKWLVIGIFGAIVAAAVALVALTPTPPAKLCDFTVKSAEGKAPAQTSVVMAPTSNFVDFNSLLTRADSRIRDSLGANLEPNQLGDALYREMSVVIADGAPNLVFRKYVSTKDDSTFAQDVEPVIKSVADKVAKVYKCSAGDLSKDKESIQLDPESDMLKALAAASDQLTIEGPKTLIVLGNGIQTTGSINMSEEGLFPSTEKIAKRLAKSLFDQGQIPNLEGVNVYWFGLGQVDGVQQKTLPNSNVKSLEVFWREAISLGGGNLVDVCSQCGSGAPSPDSISVAQVTGSKCSLIVRLYESDGVEFKADSNTFVSKSRALSAAKSTVQQFAAKDCNVLTVTGYAAAGVTRGEYERKKTDIDSVNSALTKSRAKAFGELLEEAGFAGEVNYVGAGTCGTEWDENGKVIPAEQRLCRRVEVSN